MREVAEYSQELVCDFRTVYNCSLFDVGNAVTWQEAIMLINGLLASDASETRRAMLGYSYGAPQWALNMLVLLASVAGMKKKDIKKILPSASKRKIRRKEKARYKQDVARLLNASGIMVDDDHLAGLVDVL